ncbi:Eukaryotic translation initiation factor 3 subunit G [Lamellibrachia satsuma]|nr:Eukaryotic translation initiation factor 3 subunit G [Lamellibrachia satsuma]
MPDDTDIKASWAEQVEWGDEEGLPPILEEYDEKTKTKTITEYMYNSESKKVKVVRTYKIETRKVPPSIAKRKTWKKFGEASRDPPGPNPSNTIMSEEIFMQFVHSKDNLQTDAEEDPLAKLKGHKIVSCRICKGDHWTTKCPYKDTLAPPQENTDPDKVKEGEGGAASSAPSSQRLGKYVPPNMRDGGNRRGETMMGNRRDEAATIRVTNLPEDTIEADLQELFRPFGSISRIYLAKDKATGQSKGFAFINFHRREDAARAITGVSGFGYGHLILNVEWAKPSGTQ